MNPITISLNSPWFEFVQSGIKKYEGRRCTPKMSNIKINDIINVKHHTDPMNSKYSTYQIRVLEILKFPTFEDALKSLPIEEVLPIDNSNINIHPHISVQEGVEIYKKYVSIPTQLKDGIIMFRVEVV